MSRIQKCAFLRQIRLCALVLLCAFFPAVQSADDDTARKSPSITLARTLVASAHTVVDQMRAETTRKNTPHAIHTATQVVQTARWAGAIPTAYPKPTGRANPRRVKRARRRRIKPGQLAILYPKGGLRTEIQLYDTEGNMRPEAYVQLTKALYAPGDSTRGHNAWIAYDPRVFAMLYVVAQHFQRRIEIVSAYRVPRKRRKASSNHHRGRAIDFKFKKVPKLVLRNYLDETFSPAGIGWYPNSSFVHLDTRRRSYWWTDTSRSGQRQRIRDRKPRKPKRGHDPTFKTIHLSHKRLYSRM